MVSADESSSLRVGNLCREKEKIIYQGDHSAFNKSVRDATRRRAAEIQVQQHEDKLTGAL